MDIGILYEAPGSGEENLATFSKEEDVGPSPSACPEPRSSAVSVNGFLAGIATLMFTGTSVLALYTGLCSLKIKLKSGAATCEGLYIVAAV